MFLRSFQRWRIRDRMYELRQFNGCLSVAIGFIGIMIHVETSFYSGSKNGYTARAQSSYLPFDADVEWRLSFLPTLGLFLACTFPLLVGIQWADYTTTNLCYYRIPLPPPMLHCASAYGYCFPVASSLQSQPPWHDAPFAFEPPPCAIDPKKTIQRNFFFHGDF